MATETATKEWRKVRIDECFDIQQGKQVSKSNRRGDNQHSFLRTANVFWDGLDLTVLDHMHFTPAEEKKYALQNGDLLLCEGGDVGRTAMWHGELDRCYYQNHLHRLRKLSSDIDENFVHLYLKYAFLYARLYLGRSNATTIPNLSKSRLSELEISLPTLSEQKAIARTLKAVQNAIAEQEKLIAKLKELKRSMMQHLFTHGTKDEKTKMTEIGEVPESWDVVEFKNMVEFSKKPKGLSLGKNIPFVPMDMVPLDEMFIKTYEDRKKVTSGTFVINGDILLAKITPSFENGKQGILKIDSAYAYATTEVIPFHEKENVSTKLFIHYWLKKDDVRNDLAGKMEGSTGRQRLNKTVLDKKLIPKPNILEQNKIATTLFSIDQKIGSTQVKILAYQNLLRTLLHELMSGERRINF